MTKIVIQNHKDQFALSRRQVETIIDVLPDRYFKSIREIFFCDDPLQTEPFRYLDGRKAINFSFPVETKQREDVEQAIEAILIGLARIEAGDKFLRPFRNRKNEELEAFVSKWKGPLIAALLE